MQAMFLHSPRLTEAGFRHAFFTRNGGVSEGPYASLNFSYAVGDDAARVDENLRRAAEHLQLPAQRVFFAAQVHGNEVVELQGDEAQWDVVHHQADAVVSGDSTLACGVRTADCVPVLLGDTSTGRVAAVHAGWRGVVCRVVEAASARLGGTPDNWIAAIGPHISVEAFEVSADVGQQLARASEAQDAVVDREGRKPHVDLQKIVRAQLTGLGVPPARIDAVPGCTMGDPERFFSFRRDGKASGRHLSAIVPQSR
jgi:YfiH family protein